MNAALLTVRSDSSRLPNKAFLKLGKDQKSCLRFLIDRVKKSKNIDKIIVCTTDRQIDDKIVEIALDAKVLFFRGSLEDKLERWRGACLQHNIDFFVTVDGDDLFCEPMLIDLAINQYQNDNSVDFIKSDEIICGAFTYGIKLKALEKVCQIKKTNNTEMMWVYFTDTGLFNVKNLKDVDQKFFRQDIRMTLDYQEDYDFFKEVINYFEEMKNNDFNLSDIVDLIDRHPTIKAINFDRHVDWKLNQQKNTHLIVEKIYDERKTNIQ